MDFLRKIDYKSHGKSEKKKKKSGKSGHNMFEPGKRHHSDGSVTSTK